ncbi:MAG: DUF1801 domain-containing protein [Bacteroidota bacterium]|nr:DUF1801 domain-containing protein [Bacteroidota bacterium]
MQAINKATPVKNVDEYIKTLPAKVRNTFEKVRQAIKDAAPEAEEVISYRMPAYKYNGMLVYFAAWKNHIGFYPTGRGVEAFKKELAAYDGAKGTVKFPLDKPIPFDLITKIVKFRMMENKKKSDTKKGNGPATKKGTAKY